MTAPRRVSASLAAFALASVVACLGVLIAQDAQLAGSPAASPSPSQTPRIRSSPSPTPDLGAQNFHRWGSITIFNGLPSDAVHAIAQTADGIMWFGTDNGLARFDGRRVERISLGEETSNHIQALAVNGNDLWIGTQNGAFLDRDGTPQLVPETSGSNVTAFSVGDPTFFGSDSGDVWTASVDPNGLPLSTRVGKTLLKGQSVRVSSLARTLSQIFIGTSGAGLFSIDNGTVRPISIKNVPSFINSLASDGDALLIGTDATKGASGLYRLSNNSLIKLPSQSAKTNAVFSQAGEMWAGSDRYGLVHVDSRKTEAFTFANTSGGLRSDTIFSLFVDREGVVWFGTNRGVSRYDPTAPRQESMSESPNSNFIRTFFFNKSRTGDTENITVLAGSNKGLFSFSGKGWDELSALKGRTVYAIDALREDPNHLIAGTSEGLLDLNGKLIVNGEVRDLDAFEGRSYAAIYRRGVFDISGQTPRPIFENADVTSLGGYVGKMWIGTAEDGLYSFDGQTVKLEAGPDTLKSGTIWSLWEAGYQTGLWIGGEHGIFRLRDGEVEEIAAVEGVRSVWASPDLGQKLSGVVTEKEEETNVWAATTSRGVIHARKDNNFGWLVSSLGFEQGLPSDKAFAILPLRDEMLVGTNRGVVHMTERPATPRIVPVRILSQRAHDLRELSSTIALDYPQNSLLVEVAGLSSRTFPEEFQYAWLLKNGRGEVVDKRVSHDPQFALSRLKSGEYAIEVRAINRDLLLSDPLVVRFSIGKAPFPWTVTALGVLLLIAIGGLLLAVIEHRRIRDRNVQLAAARFDLANEAERERRRIARDLHDQTLADLRQLLMRADELHAAGLRTEIETISGEIRRICEDLSPSVLENVGLIAALEHLLSTAVAKSTFHADPSVDENLNLPVNVQLQIYRILQEVLTNIRLHSDAKTVAMTIVATEDAQLKFTVEDNGSSFDPSRQRAHGRGIANIKARADLIGGRASWRGSSEGNRFTLAIDTSHEAPPADAA